MKIQTIVLGTLALCTASFVHSSTFASWTTDGNGAYWDNGANWDTNTAPNAPGDSANFQPLSTDPLTLSLSTVGYNITVGQLVFQGTNAYIIDEGFPGNTLIMDNPFGNTRIILNSAAANTINVPMQFNPSDGAGYIQAFSPGSILNITNDVFIASPNFFDILDVDGVGAGVTFSYPLTLTSPFQAQTSRVFFTGNGSISSASAAYFTIGSFLDISGITPASFNLPTAQLSADSSIEIGNKELVFTSGFSLLDGPITSSTAGGSLTFNGGSANLYGTNTYAGDTNILNNTSISLLTDDNLGLPSGNIVLTDGGGISVGSGFTTARSIITNSIIGGVSYIYGTNGLPITFSGPVSGTGPLGTSGGQGDITFSGLMSFTAPADPFQIGTKSVTLANPANTFQVSNISVFAELNVSSDGNLGDISNPIILDGLGLFHFTTAFSTNRNFLLTDYIFNQMSPIQVDSGTATITGNISNFHPSATLVKKGAGTLDLQGLNTYSSGTRIDEGVLSVSGPGILGATGFVNVNSGTSVFDIASLTAPSLTIGTLSGVANASILLGPTNLIAGNSESSLYAGTIAGTGGFTLQNNGFLTLSGTNLYFGGTTIKNNGHLSISNDNNLGASGTSVTLNVGRLESTASITTNRPFILDNNGTIIVPSAGNNFTITGVISESSAFSTLYKDGPGTLTLTNINTFNRGSSITQGKLALTGSGTAGSVNAFVGVSNGGIFDITGITTSTTIAWLDGVIGASVLLGSKDLTVDLPFIFSSGTYDGVISGTGGTFTKNGPGTQHFGGVNTYTGGTIINAGTLALTGSGTAGGPTAPINLAVSGAIFDISNISLTSTTVGNLTAVLGSTLNIGGKNLVFGGSSDTSFVGAITGTLLGSVTKQGSGKTTFSGTAKTYGGGTTISAGTLQLNAANQMAGTINNSATLDLEASVAETYAGQITGSGAVNINNGGASGIVTLSNASNSYTGGTNVMSGTLALTGNGVAGGPTSPINLTASGTTFNISGITLASTTVGNLTAVVGSTINLGTKNLIFGASGNTTFNGTIIGGTGSITKQGSGTTTLTQSNSYGGGTTINNGVLSISADNNLGNLAAGVTIGAAELLVTAPITTARPFTFTGASQIALPAGTSSFTGTMGGAGSLSLLGSGTTIFSGGAKAYAGSTTITAGLLQLNSGNQMAGTFNNSATVDLEAIALETYAGQITGTGVLNINNAGGTGVVTLSNGSNNYSGATNVIQGTLKAGAAGGFSPNSLVTLGNGVTSATLDLGGFANSISGIQDSLATPGAVTLSGDLTLTGTGLNTTFNGNFTGGSTLILNGASSNLTLLGVNPINAQINQGSLSGDTVTLPTTIGIASNGDLIINQNSDATYTGTITGAGTIDKNGPGMLSLTTGPSVISGFTGTYNANGGTTKLNTLIGGSINIFANATLSGTGTVGGNLHVYSGGIIAPGNSIGTINVLGNYIQDAGSTYPVQIDGAGASTLINVTGTATLNGGIVDITSTDGVLTENTPYTIVHASGGLTGTFTSATAHGFAGGASGLPLLSYTGTDAFFIFVGRSMFPTGKTPNQKAVAKQFLNLTSASSDLSDVILNLVNLTPDEQNAALDAMSGEQYTNYLQMTEMSSRQFIRRLYDPIQAIVTGVYKPSFDGCDCADTCYSSVANTVWFEGGAIHNNFKGNIVNARGYDSNGFELAGGLQGLVAEDVIVGIAGGYTKEHVHFKQYASGNNTIAFGGVYSLYRPKGYYILADAAYSYSANALERKIDFGSIHKVAKGKPKISQTTFYAEAGKDFNLCKMLIQPFIGIEADYFLRYKIDEKNADSLNLKVYSQKKQKTFSRLGVHLTANEMPGNMSLSVDLAWQYRLNNTKNRIEERFEEFGNQFTIRGVMPSRSSFEAAANLSLFLCEGIRIFTEFSGERWSNANSYTGLAGLQIDW